MKRRKEKNAHRRDVRRNEIRGRQLHGVAWIWTLLVHHPNLWPERTGWQCDCEDCTRERVDAKAK